MPKILTPAEQLKRVQDYCYKHRIRVPWNKVLSVGIYSELKDALPKGFITGKHLYAAIGHHVHSVAYLKRMRPGAQRYGLGYRLDGEVTKAEAQRAKDTFFSLHIKKTGRGKAKAKPARSNRKPKVIGKNTLTLKQRS